MKRLTMKDENGCFLTDKTATVTWNSLIGENRYRGEAVDRLAAIEDILGDDYDLNRLREIVEADREGRCVVLDDLTVADLWEMLTVLDSTRYGDGAETYTTGYRNGHRNGRIEILRHVLGIYEGDSAEAEVAISTT